MLDSVLAGQAYFHSFSLLLPKSWKGYLHAEEVAGIAARQADIIIMNSGHQPYQDFPYVEHSLGCGRQGNRIYVPRSFLDKNPQNTTQQSLHQAETFVNTWIDFRFGVFDFEPPIPSSGGGGLKNARKYSELVVNVSNDTIDGARVVSDQLLQTRQDDHCGGKSYEEVIGQHPDITQGTSSIQIIFKYILSYHLHKYKSKYGSHLLLIFLC